MQTAKESGYIEFDERKIEIPTSLAEGHRGVYALPISRFDEENVEFVPDGVNIYRVNEKQQVIPVRYIEEKVWRNFKKIVDKTKAQEEALRANIMNFENDFRKL